MFPTTYIIFISSLILCINSAQNLIPMFGVCNNNELCQGTAICKFHICLPAEDPTPIIIEYSNEPSISESTFSASIPQSSYQHSLPIQFIPPSSVVTDNSVKIQATQQSGAIELAQAHSNALKQAIISNQNQAQSSAQNVQKPFPKSAVMSVVVQAPSVAQQHSKNAASSNSISKLSLQSQTSNQEIVGSSKCKPYCLGTASCVQGRCTCLNRVLYSRYTGCSIIAGHPMIAVPVLNNNIYYQAVPGEKCEGLTECTGGSVCSNRKCACPPELAQQGRVCVSRAELI